MTDKPKSRGRPRLGKQNKHLLLRPKTVQFIEKRAHEEIVSLGEVVDIACKRYEDSLRSEGWGNK